MAYIRGKRAPVNGLLRRTRRTISSPLLAVSVGTAGATRNWRFAQRMMDGGRLHRLQSVVVYDYNQSTLEKIRSRLSRVKGSYGARLHLPGTVRQADGFLLNPYAFGQYLGVIDLDMNKMVAEVRKRTQDAGTPPQLIIEFLGFGGHAILGLLLHRKIREAYPEARCIPVISLPRDPTLRDWMRKEMEEPANTASVRDWMREGTWQAHEKRLFLNEHEGCLVVDNGVDTAPNDNLALGLATIECAGSDAMKGGSLPEAVAGIRHEGKGWLGMNVVRRILPSRKAWAAGFPLRRLKPVWASDDELAVQVKAAITAILTEGSLLDAPKDLNDVDQPFPSSNGVASNGHQPSNGSAQALDHSSNGTTNGTGHHLDQVDYQQRRIYVAVPVPADAVPALEQHVLSQLDAERFREDHPMTQLSFGSANFPNRPGDDEELQVEIPPEPLARLAGFAFTLATLPFVLAYRLGRWMLFGDQASARELHVTAASLYPLRGRINQIDEILHPRSVSGPRSEGESGFGTRVHITPPNGSGSADTADSQEGEPAWESGAGDHQEQHQSDGQAAEEPTAEGQQPEGAPAAEPTGDAGQPEDGPVGVPTG